MPAPIGNISSTHKAAALLEIAASLQESELAVPEASRPNNVSVTLDLEGQTASITATLPVSFALTNGKIETTATDYIP
jgi:hypothetical protein